MNHQLPESTLQSKSEMVSQTWSKLQKDNVLPNTEEFETQFYLSYQNSSQITWTFFNTVAFLKEITENFLPWGCWNIGTVAQSLETYKVRLDGASSNFIQLKMFLIFAGVGLYNL